MRIADWSSARSKLPEEEETRPKKQTKTALNERPENELKPKLALTIPIAAQGRGESASVALGK